MRIASTAIGLGLILFSVQALAQDEPGKEKLKGRVSIGIERAFGFGFGSTTATSTQPGPRGTTVENTATQSGFMVNVLGAATSSASGAPITINSPRIAFDYNIIENLTLGLSAYFAWASIRSSDNGAPTQEDSHLFGFGLAPRVGVMLPIANRLTFWGRAGLTYSRLGTGTPDRVTGGGGTRSTSDYESLFWLNVEPTLLITIAPHVAVGTALVLDVPLAGVNGRSQTTTVPGGATTTVSSSVDETVWNVGLQFGLTVWL